MGAKSNGTGTKTWQILKGGQSTSEWGYLDPGMLWTPSLFFVFFCWKICLIKFNQIIIFLTWFWRAQMYSLATKTGRASSNLFFSCCLCLSARKPTYSPATPFHFTIIIIIIFFLPPSPYWSRMDYVISTEGAPEDLWPMIIIHNQPSTHKAI